MKSTLVKLATPLAAACGLIAATTAFASNDMWVGNTDVNWSTAANWTFSSGSAVNPSGDFLIFGAAGTAGALLNNDLSGYSFAGITYNSGASAFALSGNSLSLAGGITNNAANAQTNNLNLTLTANEIINAAAGNVTLGGVIGDGGSGYGLTFQGGHTVSLLGASSYSGATTNLAGTLAFVGAGSVSNSSIFLGKAGSGVGAYLTIGGATQAAGTNIIASNLTVTASVVGGNNFGNLNAIGTANGNVTEQFLGALQLNAGLFRSAMAPNAAGNFQLLFNSFARSPGTALSFDRGTAPGVNPIANLTAGAANIIFTIPPTLLGTGTAGTTSNGIVQGVTIADGPATYDTTSGLRGLNSGTEQVLLSSGLAAPAQNARATTGTAISAATEVNSLAMQGSFTITLGGNTLTVDAGYVGSTVNGVIGSAANDGFLALGTEGFFDVANARTLTVNSVITGSGGLTVNLDDFNGTGANCVLAGTNTFTGVTRVLGNQTMTLKLNNSLALQNSTLDYNSYGGTITFGSGLTSFTFGGLSGAQNLAIAVPLTIGGDGDSTVYSGVLSGAGSLIKTGSGTFTPSNANTYTGGTTLSGGQLNINNGGTSSANSAIGTGPLTLNGGTIDNTSGTTVTLAPNNAQNWNGNFTFAGSTNLNLGTGLVALGGNEQVTVNASTLTVGGGISGAGFSLTKAGNGALTLSGTTSYTGNTIVAGGKLALGGSATLGTSPNITVSNAATLDVSGISFTLGGSQSLLGGGTNNGSVATSSGSKIYAGTDGGYGTNTFNNNLTLASGAAAYFDLGTTTNGMNDRVSVAGNLTLNGNTLHIKAPSSAVNLDTNDYTLFAVTGTLSGSAAVTPAWDVQPLNFANYTITNIGNAVKLHYASIRNPVGTGSANPNLVSRGQSTVITVSVTTAGSAPVSTVTVNATPIGGASSVTLVQVGATASYTNTVTVGAGVPAGSTQLTATITDGDGGSASVPVALTVLAGAETWNGGSVTGNNWTDTANWVGGISPLGGDAVTFAGSTRPSPLMDNSFNLGSVTFAASTASFAVTNSTGSVLTLSGGGVTNNSANSESLNVPVSLAAAQTFNAANGNLALGGVISGSSPLTLVGNNALTLSGTNTYGGGTTVGAGTVVVANNSALGSGVLTLGGGAISNAAGGSYSVPNNVTVSSAANVGVGTGDTFTLSGTISGGGTLVKVGGGTLNLPSANNLNGGVTVNAGTLVVGNNAAIGNGLLSVGNASVSNSAGANYTLANSVNVSGAANVIVGTGDQFTLSGALTNTGSLTKTGNGTLIIGGISPSTYSGGTTLAAGLLDVENTGGSALGTGTLTLAGGTLENNGGAGITLSNNIVVVTNTTTALHPTSFNGNGLTLAGNISGSGNLVVDGSGTTFDSFILAGSNSAFTGTLTVNNGADQRFAFGSPSAGSPNAVFVLNSTGTDNQKFIFGGTNTISFGSLSGAGQLRNDGGAGLTTLRIGDLNTSTAFNGLIVGNGVAQFGLLKVGTGKLTMTNNSTYSGLTEVAAGELDISVAQGAAHGFQVDDGATLGIINYAGTGLFAGQSSGMPSLTLGTNSGATLLFTNLDNSAATGPLFALNLTNNGTCNVVITDTNNLAAGNTYKLIAYSSYTSSGAGNFVLAPGPVQGYVTNDTGVSEIALVVTNIASVNPNPTNITVSVNGTNLSLSWPGDHLGWYLQVQTNSLGKGISTNWVDVPGSSGVTNVNVSIDPNNGAVFYRMSLNP